MTTTTDQRSSDLTTDDPLLRSALDQFHDACFSYNEAIGSYNTHLDNHRERRDLYDVPFRTPISAHEDLDAALRGDEAAIESVLEDLIDQAHLDSQVRRHPRVFPIHIEAVDHLELARAELVSTLEDALHRIHSAETSPSL